MFNLHCLNITGVLRVFWQEELVHISLLIQMISKKSSILQQSAFQEGSSQDLLGISYGNKQRTFLSESKGRGGGGLGTVGERRSTLLLHFLCVKVPARLAATLVPAHVRAEVLLPDDLAVHRPLVPQALKCQSSWKAHAKDESAHVTVIRLSNANRTL